MANWKKILIGTGIGGSLAAGITYMLRLNRASAELETVPSVKLHKLDLTGLYIRVDVQLKNPTRTGFSLKFPFVKLLYKGATLGSSQSINKNITVPAYGEANVQEIMIRIPPLSLLSNASELAKGLKSGESVKVEVNTISTINLGWKKIPYNHTDDVFLKGGETNS
jgi:hypothetical protein